MFSKNQDKSNNNINNGIDNDKNDKKKNDNYFKIIKKYPEHIPLYIQKNKNSSLPDLEKKKFLIPKKFDIATILQLIRKKTKLKPEEGLFVFIGDNNIIPKPSDLICELYDKHKSSNELLNVTYDSQNVFGY